MTDIGGEVLCGKFFLSKSPMISESESNDFSVSQFTLLERTKKGTKPDFHGAANPEDASRLYHYFVQKVKQGYQEDRVKDGKFQAMMEVALVNDGPVSRCNYVHCCTIFTDLLVVYR